MRLLRHAKESSRDGFESWKERSRRSSERLINFERINEMRINIHDLKRVSDQLFSHLEEIGHNSVEITEDYYWNIPKEHRYDPMQEPKEFDLGQLTEDWSELQQILNRTSEPISYALVWLSSLLRNI